MRVSCGLLALLLACASKPSTPASEAAGIEKTRIVYRQYLRGSAIFVLENLAGRDLAELRSRPLKPGRAPVAYVPDDVMERLMREFRRFDFDRYAVPRPADPRRLGASGELTRIDAQGRRRSLLRIKLRPGQTPTADHLDRSKAYVRCAQTYLAVWNAYRPRMQATTSTGGGFGVKRAEYGRR